jgi:carboxypeptidase T
VRTLFADRRGPGDNDAAPPDTSGVLISLHSYSDLVLWPWGQQASGPAPNAEGLARLGQRLAAFNGYTPFQAYNLYDTSGTTDDWSYGELGVASYTFEIGPTIGSCGGFFPPYSCLDGEPSGSFWPRNLPALRYAARVTRAPYQLPFGPDVAALAVSDTGSVTLTATLGGDGPINDAEAYLDAPPWRGGTPTALRPADGRFDTNDEQATLSFGAGAGRERRLVLVRARSNGTWGPFSAAFVSAPTQQPNNLYLSMVRR